MKRILIALIALVSLTIVSQAQTAPPAKKTITAFTEKMQKIDGFMPLYVNSDDGKIYIEIARFNQEFLYLVSLPRESDQIRLGLIAANWVRQRS